MFSRRMRTFFGHFSVFSGFLVARSESKGAPKPNFGENRGISGVVVPNEKQRILTWDKTVPFAV